MIRPYLPESVTRMARPVKSTDGRRAPVAMIGVVVLGALVAQALMLSPVASVVTALVPPSRALAAAPASAATFTDGTPYPGPLPLALPASGGTIQAENFNVGPPEQASHACTPGDQGNASGYRTDAHDIDISKSGSAFYITSSTLRTSADPAHNCSGPAPFLGDYVKYSFTVATTGWYTFVAGASNGRLWTRVDDVNVGETHPVGPWANVLLATAVHLTAGPTHVLAIEMLGVRTALDAVRVSPVTVHFPQPRIVSAPLTKNEVVVADAVATDPQFGAVPNRTASDSRAAIQNALTTVGAEGGGTVFLPPGVYTVHGPLFVPPNVTLRGDWSSTTSRSNQTILAAVVPVGSSGNPFITLAGTNATVSHLGVWYPKQSVTRPLHYPPTIGSNTASVTVDSVTLYNSDRGIFFDSGSAADISNVRATCFTTCISDDGNLEFAFMTNITISNQIWATAPASIRNRPKTAASRAALHKWTARHLTAMHLYRNDNLTVYGVHVRDALHGIVTTRRGCTPACGTYGSFSKIGTSLDRRGDAPTSRARSDVNSIMLTDRVAQARKIVHPFPPARRPARTTAGAFYNVKAAPFSARADGFSDDTAALQNALNTAGFGGGGTVYLPSGTYLVSTHLTVPSGVELRGAYGARHTSETIDSTTLLAVEGQGTAAPNTDTAFISLRPRAGVRGISVRYPNQGFGSAAYPVVAFPYTFRTFGPGTWLQDIDVLNGYQVADLTTVRSDAFVIDSLWATAFVTGVNIGGRTNTGWLDRSVMSYGSLYQSRHGNSPHAYGRTAIANYTKHHLVAYYLGGVNGLQSLGAMSYNALRHLVTYPTNGAGPTNAVLFASSSDSAASVAFQLGAGTNLAFVGMLTRSSSSPPGVATARSFVGIATVHDSALAGRNPVSRQGGILRLYRER
jgi:hypothetical protein